MSLTEKQTEALKAFAPAVYKGINKIPEKEHISDLRRDRKRIINSMRAITGKAEAEGRDLNTSEQHAWEALEFLQDVLEDEINARENRGDLSPSYRPVALGNEHSRAPEGWVDSDGHAVGVYGPKDRIKPENSFNNYGGLNVGGMMRAMVMGARNEHEFKALSEGTDSAGGYTVPIHLLQEFIDLMRAKTVCVNAGAITVILETEKTTIARVASDPVAAWRTENALVAESDPTFEQVQFQARSLAVLVKASRELIEDSVNVEEILMASLAGALAVEVDRVALFGTGTAPEPRGISNTTGVHEIDMGTDGAALTSYAQILAAMQKTAESNAEMPTAAIMAPREYFTLAGLEAADGQPLIIPKVAEELPFMMSTSVPTDETHGAASNASRMIVGDFTQLMLGVRSSLRIEVLKERYAENLQTGFLAHLRFDVALAHPESFCQVTGIIPA